jgi:16S rRNA (adenine1518-N6/adenine1519-N6)-dimethyltransferase
LNVLEVGPGTGALTIPLIYRLMEEGHDAVLTLVELDERVIDPLLRRLDDALAEAEASSLPGRLAINLLQGDALAVTQHPTWSSSFDLIYGNLPFNISTQLLVSWLNHGIAGSLADAPDLALVMQREVGMRCVARPNDSARSRLSVMSQIAHQPRLAATLPPGVFRPIPKVHSTLVHFAPLEQRLAPGADLQALQPIVRELFHHRRKMIGKAAQRVWDGDGEAARAWLERAKVRPDQRAQELTNAQWCDLATDETLRSVSMLQSIPCEDAGQAPQ